MKLGSTLPLPIPFERCTLAFVVPGEPQAWQRPINTVTKSGKRIQFTPHETENYESLVRLHAMRAAALLGWPKPTPEDRYSLVLEIRLGNARRKDLSNILKSVEDGLQPKRSKGVILAGGVILDDWQICRFSVLRVLRHDSAGVLVRLTATDETIAM
jgi:Holliday junction resolvase RusA-like endonuclease